ncbi:MAG: hypothetical protein ACO3JL_07610, partial [Myxococcota bacterium]
ASLVESPARLFPQGSDEPDSTSGWLVKTNGERAAHTADLGLNGRLISPRPISQMRHSRP